MAIIYLAGQDKGELNRYAHWLKNEPSNSVKIKFSGKLVQIAESLIKSYFPFLFPIKQKKCI